MELSVVGDELPSLAVTTPLGFIVDDVLPEAAALVEPSLEEAEEKASLLYPILTASKEDPVAEVSMLVIEEKASLFLLVVEVFSFIAIVDVSPLLSNVKESLMSLMVEASFILIVAVSAFSLVAAPPSLPLTAEVSLVVLDGLHVDASNLSPAIESTSYFRWMIFSRAAPTQSTHRVSKSPVSGFA